jgi:hypothetical protein
VSEDKIVAMSIDDASTWMRRWPDLLDGLAAEERRTIVTAVADNVLEGWQPSHADVQALVDVVCGKTSTEDYIRSVAPGASDIAREPSGRHAPGTSLRDRMSARVDP